MEVNEIQSSLPHYAPPRLLFTNHLETIYPALLRKVNGIGYTRERIFTPDQDFLDLDWLIQPTARLVIISHGLEGNTQRAYIKGMAKAFFDRGYDVLTWNYRGCGEEMNWQLRFYHSGATDDLDVIIQHAIGKAKYSAISLIGLGEGYARQEAAHGRLLDVVVQTGEGVGDRAAEVR